jgi:glucosamine-phosphate N-acetyltransferase
MTIREFQKGDEAGLLEILKETWYITEIQENVLSEWMTNNYNFVAVEEQEIIGTITLHLQRKLIRNGGLAGFIEDVAVKEKFRGNKIGFLLVQKALEKARDLGCYKVILSCFDERVNFYEKSGFFRECNTMRVDL